MCLSPGGYLRIWQTGINTQLPVGLPVAACGKQQPPEAVGVSLVVHRWDSFWPCPQALEVDGECFAGAGGLTRMQVHT